MGPPMMCSRHSRRASSKAFTPWQMWLGGHERRVKGRSDMSGAELSPVANLPGLPIDPSELYSSPQREGGHPRSVKP